MDAFQQEDRGPPPLYPHVDQAFPADLTEVDQFVIDRASSLSARYPAALPCCLMPFLITGCRFRESSSYLSRAIIDKSKPVKRKELDVHALFGADRDKYVPAELFGPAGSKTSKTAGRQSDIFQKLEQAEGSAKEPAERKEGEESDGEGAEEADEEMPEEDDYMVDHYASDNDNDNDNDDNEATF